MLILKFRDRSLNQISLNLISATDIFWYPELLSFAILVGISLLKISFTHYANFYGLFYRFFLIYRILSNYAYLF